MATLSLITTRVKHFLLYNVISLIQVSIYFKVPRILNPIVNVIEAIPQLVSENKGGLGDLIKKNYGSAEECQISILQVIPFHMTHLTVGTTAYTFANLAR